MDSVNRVTLFGFLERDPELREGAGGGRVAKLVISTSEGELADVDGAQTEHHQIIVSDDVLVEVVERDLRKGSKVYIEARVRSHLRASPDGRENWTAELIVGHPDGRLITFAGRHGIGDSHPIHAVD